MALTDSEVQRLKYELGFNVLATGAEPYISIVAVFDQVIKPYTLGGAATTSTTPVTAASTPTPQSLTLASATGFAAGNVVVVDVDGRQEKATIQSMAGSSITCLLSLAHGSGSYPVVVEGGESIIREILRELVNLSSAGIGGVTGAMASVRNRLGLRRVDEVEFFGGGTTSSSQGADPLSQLIRLREFWRDELASVLGIMRLNGPQGRGGSDVSIY